MKNWNGQEESLKNPCRDPDPPDVWAVTRESKNYALRSEFSNGLNFQVDALVTQRTPQKAVSNMHKLFFFYHSISILD